MSSMTLDIDAATIVSGRKSARFIGIKYTCGDSAQPEGEQTATRTRETKI